MFQSSKFTDVLQLGLQPSKGQNAQFAVIEKIAKAIPSTSDSRSQMASSQPPQSLDDFDVEIVKQILDHEFNLLKLKQKACEQFYKILQKFPKPPNETKPVYDVVKYLACWMIYKYLRGYEVVKSRTAMKYMFYSFLELPSVLLNSAKAGYESFKWKYPQLLTKISELESKAKILTEHLKAWVSEALRDDSVSVHKTKLSLLVNAKNFQPWASPLKELSELQRDALFSLLRLDKEGALPANLAGDIQDLISKSYLLLVVELLPPMSWNKEGLEQTQLISLDWDEIKQAFNGSHFYSVAKEEMLASTVSGM